MGDGFASPEEAVERLLAVQSQDFAAAKWAIGLRVPGATDASVEDAFASGAILRTHVLRPTWHFVTPADIRWLLRLTSPRVEAQNASRYRELGLDDRTLGHGSEVIAAALAEDRQLTRRELAAHLNGAGIGTDGQRLAYLVMHAELAGLICSGPRVGKQHTYALLDERAPGPHGPSGDEALAEIALRFFTSHGPATVHDLAWWSGLRVSDAAAAVGLVDERLERSTVGDRVYWHVAAVDDSPSAEALLLPDYDESFVGYRHLRAKFRGGEPEATLLQRPLLFDGEAIGTWKRTVKGKNVHLVAVLREKPSRGDAAAIEAAAERYARFVELPGELEIA